MSSPMVSVVMITYKHENYIAKAIEGVLMQEASFDFELVIADDCSPDGTANVVNHYINTHPNGHRINYLRHLKNVGMQENFILGFDQCKGKYIALCEGDDYWTDSHKLQKQVDFLEANPEVLLCGHNGDQLEPDGNLSNEIQAKRWYQFEDFAAYGCPVKTMSILFRNLECFRKCFTGEWIYNLSGGDQLIFFTASKKNKVYVLEDNMGVYRKHPGGSWAMIENKKRLNYLYNDIALYKKNMELNFRQKMYLNWKLKGVLVGYLYENNPRSGKLYWPKRFFHILINKGLFFTGPGYFSGMLVELWLKFRNKNPRLN
jgi:glycosyltransferase involved in cell wall biosynthesis